MQELTGHYGQDLARMKACLHADENFDIVCRNIIMTERKAALFYIDGFVKDSVMQKLLQYFMDLTELPKGENASLALAAKLPYVEVDVSADVERLVTFVLSGAAIMLVEGFGPLALVIDCRTYPARTTKEPDNDRVMQGAHDGFVETLIFNTALIRRRIRDPNLVMQYENMGGSSRTDVVVCYMKGRADEKYVRWLLGKLRSVHPGALTLGTQSLTESLIRRSWYNPFPKIRYTERPDAAAAELMEGRVLLLCDTSPQVMVLPTSIFDFMQETDDFYFPPLTGCYLRLVRHAVFWLALFWIPLWYLMLTYMPYLPSWMQLFAPRSAGSIPIWLQILLAEMAIDGLKLASMNTPSMLNNSLSVIGGLLLGEFAVEAGWLCYEVIFYMAMVAIAGFTQQNHELGYAFKLLRLVWLVATVLFGIWGFAVVALLIPLLLASNKTLNGGKSYLYPLIPFDPRAFARLFFRLGKRDVYSEPYPERMEKNDR